MTKTAMFVRTVTASSLLAACLLPGSFSLTLSFNQSVGPLRTGDYSELGGSTPHRRRLRRSLAWPPPHRSNHDRGSQRQLGPSTGTIRALVVLIRFPEHSQRQLPTPDDFKAVCEGPVAEYLSQQSYGQFTISGCDVTNWVESDNTEAYYSFGNYGRVTREELQPLLYPALNMLDVTAAASNPNFWQQYDSDYDTYIDLVVGIHSGYGSQFAGSDCETGRAAIDRIQTQAFNGVGSSPWVSSQATGVYNLEGFTILHAMEQACGNKTVKMGIMAHEIAHTLMGYPRDLYDFKVGGAGIGGFDIMSSAYGPTFMNGDVPGSMSPWTKMKASWINPEEVVADGTYTMRPSTLFPDYYVIRSGFPDQEYLLLEYRTNATGGFEADFYGAGMVIYHVDDTVDMNRKIGYPGQSGWPSNGNLYQVSVLQADRLYDIEKKVNGGDSGDLWTAGMTIGTGSLGVYPNTDSLRGGVETPTGITITVVSVDGSELIFNVSGLAPPVPFSSAPVASPTGFIDPPSAVYPTGVPAFPSPATSAPVVTASITPATGAPGFPTFSSASPVTTPVLQDPSLAVGQNATSSNTSSRTSSATQGTYPSHIFMPFLSIVTIYYTTRWADGWT